jgi:glycosyltransferase involved in cell wall biosynthesis
MKPPSDGAPSICFVGLNNLPALAPEFRHLPMGGAELQQTLLAKGLARAGFQVSMVVADLGQPDGTTWSGVRTFKAFGPDAGLPGLRFVHPRWTGVWAALKRANATIRYCSCAGLLPGQLALFTRSHPGKVVFRIAHDSDCHPDKLLIPNWRAKTLYRYGIKHVDLILAQSETQRVDMRRNFGRDSRVIPSMLEPSLENREFDDRDIDVLWVSNIRPFKRPDLALDWATQSPAITLHMIGGTQPDSLAYFDEVKQRAASIPNVRFHGPKPYDEVNAHLARTRVFANTSDTEGFPNTYLQAWARGTPVVGFFDPDGVIAREGLGRTVHNIGEMHAAIQEFLTNRELWMAVSRRCREYVEARHGGGALKQYIDALLSLERTSVAA